MGVLSLTTNSARSVLADLDDPALAPHGWNGLRKPELRAPEDATIYELHIRDFSITDETVPAAHRGTYLAFTDRHSDGMRHLRDLARAGHEHAAPAAEQRHRDDRGGPLEAAGAGVRPARRSRPTRRAAGLRQRRSRAPTASTGATTRCTTRRPRAPTRPTPTGRRARCSSARWSRGSTAPACAWSWTSSTTTRPRRGRTRSRSSTAIVPGYYQRLDPATGAVETSTCCSNTATEHLMMGKLLVDSVLTWATQYKVDGFRFDLMGHQPKALMVAAAPRARRAHAQARRRGRRARSSSTARAGTSARWRTTRASSRPASSTWPAPGSRRSPTGCATPSAAAGRSTTTRASRASPAGCSPTPTARPRTARRPSSARGCCTTRT